MIWTKLCYFVRVVVLNLNFCIVAMFQETAIRGTRLKTTEGRILYLTPLLSDWSEFLHKWRFQWILTFLKVSCLYHSRFLRKPRLNSKKKIENDFFQECLISKRWRIWIWFCYFMKVAWLDLNFCIVAFCQISAVRGKRACTN